MNTAIQASLGLAHRRRIGNPDFRPPRVAGITVGSDEIERLDQKIRQLTTDVHNQGTDPVMMLQWTDFLARWETWRAGHTTLLQQTAVPVIGDPNVAADFEAFVGEYNEKLRVWEKAGVKTDAGRDTAFDSPLQKAWEGLTGAVGTAGAIAVGAATVYLAYEAYRSAEKR